MGGFRFNGCGVTDHFKHIKSLGTHICPNCNKLSEFTLDEANQKIDVFWIPTLTLKSRYAVMCTKCKNGEFCSVEWAGYLMNQTADQEVIFESAAKNLKDQANTVEEPVEPAYESAAPALEHVVTDPGAIGQAASSSADITCPSCGSVQEAGNKFCIRCGQKLIMEQPKGKFCSHCGAKIIEGMLFCMECGSKI